MTGKEPDEVITNIIDLKEYGKIDENSVWGKAARLLDEAYDETGYTYYEAIYRYEALINGIGVENEAVEPMPSPVPPPPPREEDMEKYEKELTDFEYEHGTWQYGKHWNDIKELNESMEKSGFVIPNSKNCYTYKSEYDEKYYFMPDNDATNIVLSAFGGAPFGKDIAKLLVEEGTGNEYMDSDGINTADILGLLEYSTETVPKALGKAAGIASFAETLYDIGDTIISNTSEINQLTQKIFGDTIASSTREGCLAK